MKELETTFTVALHYGDDEVGYLSYDKKSEQDGGTHLTVVLPDEEYVARVVGFLQQPLTLQDARGLNTYEEVTIDPLASVDTLKLALTRLWNTTDVQVDWSRPVHFLGETSSEG